MAIDKEKAVALRLGGMSLQDVADALECSLGWCKANLKGVKQANKDKELIESVRKLGRSNVGVTTGEIKLLTMKHHNSLKGTELEDKVSDIKKAARRGNKDVIVRPYWMLPDCPRDCTLAMLEYANEVYTFKQQLADKYMEQFNLDASYGKTVVHALTMLSAGENSKLMPQGLLSYGATLERIQDALDSRNNPSYKSVSTKQDEYFAEVDMEDRLVPDWVLESIDFAL